MALQNPFANHFSTFFLHGSFYRAGLQIDYQKTPSPALIGLDGGDKRALAVFFRSLRLEYPVGELAVDFSSSGNLGDAALFGFWRSEPEGTWSAGARSALV